MSNTNSAIQPITKTAVNIEPVGVIYNLTSTQIEEFIVRYFTEKGLRGIKGAAVIPEHSAKLKAFLCINSDSEDITSKGLKVAAPLADKLNTFNPSKQLRDAVSPFVYRSEAKLINKKGIYIIELDIFRVLGFMLAATPKYHNINIYETRRQGKETIARIIKLNKVIDPIPMEDSDLHKIAMDLID